MNIDYILDNLRTYSLEDFFNLWEAQKDIFIVKYDGVRETGKYNVILLGNNSRFDAINIRCDELYCGIEEVLLKYKDILENPMDYPA